MEFNGKAIYTEDSPEVANSYRKAYADSIDEYLADLADRSDRIRHVNTSAENMAKDRERYRREYISMLGVPLTEYKPGVPKAEREFVGEDEFGKIYRLTVCTVAGIQFYGILSVPHTDARHPLLIAQHGGGGTPELVCDINSADDVVYSNIAKRALEKGCVVFAPQLLLWNRGGAADGRPVYDVNYNRAAVNARLKQYGGSVTALEIYNIRKSIDYLTSLEFVDGNRIGMIGLSYGGYFTMYTAAVDTRIKTAYACGFFNDRNKIGGFEDWKYFGSALRFHDAEVAGLCAPRRLFIDVGKSDGVFNYHTAIAEAEIAKTFYSACGCADNFTFNLWDGGHRIDINGQCPNRFFEHLINGSK